MTEEEWHSDPQLSHVAFDSLDEVKDHLTKLHHAMMDGEMGCIGYLYRQQTLRVREITERLKRYERK